MKGKRKDNDNEAKNPISDILDFNMNFILIVVGIFILLWLLEMVFDYFFPGFIQTILQKYF